MDNIPILFASGDKFSREWLASHPENAQTLLADNVGSYAKCLCRVPHQDMYIAKRSRSRLYLARMPNTGWHHAPYCPSYEPDPHMCGRGTYSDQAIKERPGKIIVNLDAALLIRGPGATTAPPSAPPQPGSGTVLRNQLTLRGLLHLLWEKAGFNRWAPKMQGRRGYRQIRKFTYEAAQSITVKRRPLSQHLYIPEPYDEKRSLELDNRSVKEIQLKSKTGRGAPQRIIFLGELEAFEFTRPLHRLRFAHASPELSLLIEPPLVNTQYRLHEFAFPDWPRLQREIRLICLFTMQRELEGDWQVQKIVTMPTTDQYIPIESPEDLTLAKQLHAEERRYYKPLRYDATFGYANFLLTDTSENATPLEILVDDATVTFRHERIDQYRRENLMHWVWQPSNEGDLPRLPPPAHKAADQSQPQPR